MHAGQPHARRVIIVAQCGAKTRAGGNCKNSAMANGRCRMHGGKTPIGAGSPQFKTGRYSRYMPRRLADRYQEARDDPELLALREEIALLDAHLADLLGRVDRGESGALWLQLRQTYQDLNDARLRGDGEAIASFLSELGTLILRGASNEASWAEIRSTLDQRRRLVESERKRYVEMQQMITAERAMILIGAIVDVIRSHVTDRTKLAAISADIRSLVSG